MKQPLFGSEELLEEVLKHLGPSRPPRLIGIDGPDGTGKSSLASSLDWQLSAPSLHLDMYLITGSDTLQWRTDCLQTVVTTRLDERAKPLIVEGVMLLDVLARIGRKADFLAYVDGQGSDSLSTLLADYRARCDPIGRANLHLEGYEHA